MYRKVSEADDRDNTNKFKYEALAVLHLLFRDLLFLSVPVSGNFELAKKSQDTDVTAMPTDL